jgi:hypothetical protein
VGRGAPVHPLIPDDAMTVSNQPCVDGRQFARFLKCLCNAGWSGHVSELLCGT